MNIRNRISFYRKKYGYSQKFLADYCNISRNSIILFEQQKMQPRAAVIADLLIVFNCEFWDIFTYE